MITPQACLSHVPILWRAVIAVTLVALLTWVVGVLWQVYKLDPARLYATYFGGEPAQGLDPDEEAKGIW